MSKPLRRVVGIDPGKEGGLALALVAPLGELVNLRTAEMPTIWVTKGEKRRIQTVDAARVAGILRDWRDDIGGFSAWVEDVHAMPGNSPGSMFSFGRSAGIVLGALAGLQIPVTMIAPATWKAGLKCPADKNSARHRASELMPAYAHCWPLARLDGLAEAAMIALYGGRSVVFA